MTQAPEPERLLELLESFAGRRVLVLGDLVLDEFLHGDIRRVSREAPVLILDCAGSSNHLGGGANAVRNLHRLGARVLPIGVVGNDASGRRILEILRGLEIDTSEVAIGPKWETPTKTRILAGLPQSAKQQVLRIDRGRHGEPPEGAEGQLLASLRRRAGEAEGLLISDYGYGAIGGDGIAAALAVTRRSGLRVIVDSRRQLPSFRGITAATPNLEELEEATGSPIGDDREALLRAGRKLRERVGAEALLVTMGSRGMTLFRPGAAGPESIPASGPPVPVDVTGAGDTVVAAFTMGILAGGRFRDAAWIANVAAGLAVMQPGTAAPTAAEIGDRIRSGTGKAG